MMIFPLTALSGPAINERTLCNVAVAAFDNEDRATAHAILTYIREVMLALDGAYTARGQESALASLNEESFGILIVAAAVRYCGRKPAATIHSQAVTAYNGFRAMRSGLGVQ